MMLTHGLPGKMLLKKRSESVVNAQRLRKMVPLRVGLHQTWLDIHKEIIG